MSRFTTVTLNTSTPKTIPGVPLKPHKDEMPHRVVWFMYVK